jgi:murein DD-endopeptidase MepM/ murein hydrolase activator NlpD
MVKPLKEIYVTCPFGRPGSWAAGYHTGIDYRATPGTPVYATKGGTVVGTGWYTWGTSYGNHVVIRSLHNGILRKHGYCHLTRNVVSVGQKVKVGQLIGYSGDTGNTFGPHLHYEERVSPFGYYNHRKPVLPDWKPVVRVTVHLSRVKPGKTNRDIKRLQRRLNRRLNAGLPVTGYFGSMTRRAYKKWQERIGYSGKGADGIPGRRSLERLGFRVKD